MQKEINKLLKRISVEKLKNNHKECIELYNIVGGLYTDIGSYDEAAHYHEQALDLCKMIGDRLGTAIAFRFIGEAKAALGQFYQAIDYIKKYLDLAQKANSKVEIQRAWTTLGRVYLMQAQELKDGSHVLDDNIKEAALEAEKRFQTALNLADSVREQVDEKEFMQMKSGLLINIGLIKDIMGQHTESVLKFNRAIELCKSAKLKEDLYRCQIILTGIFRQRNNIKMAVRSSDDALNTAKQIGKKINICDALIEKGLVQICQRDFKSAKRTFAQAYLEKSPSEEDHSKSIRLTKLAHLITTHHEKLAQDNITSEVRMKLCDKLGDLFIAVSNYKLAVEFYRRAFTEAKLCCKSKYELARILVSIAETYADDGHFQHALVFYEKELTYRNGNDKEQCHTLIKIAHMHEYLQHDPEKTSKAYEKALQKAGKDPKLMYNVLTYYCTYLEKKKYNEIHLKELEKTLANLKSYPEVINELDTEGHEEADDPEDDISDIDDIITDDEDNDEIMMVGKRRNRGAKKFKPNEVGDTPLHEACIKGDIKRVKLLISQGHEVNPRDNAGWIPLHEACNHGHLEIVEYLIENGADVSNRGLKGMSPLHDAATNGHYDIMRLLIRSGANVIALTDTGETVLNCLRDYKKRNYTDMSNQDISDYKAMESELLNTMDKCGFNLMEENIKNIGAKKPTTTTTNDVIHETRPRPRNQINTQEIPTTNPVRDYRHVIGGLKRKRAGQERDTESPERANLPATYNAGTLNPSATTKEWLIDDVSREKRSTRGLIGPAELIEFEEGFSDDDIQVEFQHQQSHRGSDDTSLSKSKPISSKRAILDSDDEGEFRDLHENSNRVSQDNDIMIIEDNLSNSVQCRTSHESYPLTDLPTFQSPSPAGSETYFLNQGKSDPKSSPRPTFNLLDQPLTVKISDRQLLIPIKDENLTIKSLKDSIVERYSALSQTKPIISLSPISNPECTLFDNDLCIDVIKENLVANIESWQLDTIDEIYCGECEKSQSIKPLNFLRAELRRVQQSGNKLDLSFSRFPKDHVRPILQALAHRDFSYANLSGSVTLLECSNDGTELLETIASWRKLKNLKLTCIGLRQCHFETICNKIRLPELNSLDVSVNSIAYKCREEFKKDVESLLESCRNLKRLDIRKNHLQFMKSILEMSDDCESLSLESEMNSSVNLAPKILDYSVGKMYMRGGRQTAVQNRYLDFELLATDQNEYSAYSV